MYDPSKEQREDTVLDNCISAGVDPTALGYDFENGQALGTTSTEIITAGTTSLDAEESTSFTYGFVYDIPNGHTLGASGGLSLELAIHMLQHQEFISIPFLNAQKHPNHIKKILVNAVGFGGNAVSILVSLN